MVLRRLLEFGMTGPHYQTLGGYEVLSTIRKPLYGLKKSPRVWYDRIDGFLKSLGLHKNDADTNMYFNVRGNQPIILILYVDDLFLTRDEGIIS
jgi:hypothetical protein